MRDKRQVVRWICLTGLLCAYIWIAWRVPYTHDDWDWGLPVGLERWRTGALNSRYAGTLFVLAMTRSPWIKTLVMGFSMFLIPQLAVRLTGVERGRRFSMELLAHSLMFSMPIVTWRQTYGWVSSFANYVTASVWMLLVLLLLRQALWGRGRWWTAVLLFPLSLTCQLFVENLSGFMVILTTAAAGYALKTHRDRAAALSALAGTLVGLALMFYNPLYGDLISTGTAVDGIRNLAFPIGAGPGEIASVVIWRGLTFILPSIFEAHPVLWAVIALACMLRCVKQGRSWFLFFSPLAASYLTFSWWNAWKQSRETWVCPWPWLRAVGAAGLLILIVLALWGDRMDRWPSLLLLAAALILVAPFALVSDSSYGPRCCYPSLVFLLLLAILLFRDMRAVLWREIGVGLVCLGLLLFHLRAYWTIGRCSELRASLLQEAVEQNIRSVTLPTESKDVFYMWGRNPASDERAGYFRQFYGLPEDLQLVFLPKGSYDLWPNVSEEMLEGASIYN